MNEDCLHEDLSDFDDYLAEFESILNFDSENCPICGIEIPENVTSKSSTYILYKLYNSESELQALIKELLIKDIPYKIVKRLNTEVMEEVNYIFEIMIPLKYLSDLG